MSELRTKLEEAKPYYGMDQLVSKTELRRLGIGVEQAAAAAHQALYLGHAENNPSVGIFDDLDSKFRSQYISFKDKSGNVCYGPWDPTDPGTDIGIRGANPDFKGELNPTTVLHADLQTLVDYQRRGAPQELLDALDAAHIFTRYVVDHIARPYLEQVAEAFKQDPKAYLDQFIPDNQRAHLIQRVILYHANAPEGMRPENKDDDEELLIKPHRDKSSYTIDALQSSKGLQYKVNGEWCDADETKVACFRGVASDLLGRKRFILLGRRASKTPGTWHRAISCEDYPGTIPDHLVDAELVRGAFPLFLNPVKALRVKANSKATHG